MTNTLDLNKMGLAPMSNLEMQEVDGGGWPTWLKGISWATAVTEVIDNWEDIKKGFKDGWNALK